MLPAEAAASRIASRRHPGRDAGVPGLEPRLTEPESGVLPITPYPMGVSPQAAADPNADGTRAAGGTQNPAARRGAPRPNPPARAEDLRDTPEPEQGRNLVQPADHRHALRVRPRAADPVPVQPDTDQPGIACATGVDVQLIADICGLGGG